MSINSKCLIEAKNIQVAYPVNMYKTDTLKEYLIRQIKREFGGSKEKKALKGLDFSVNEGECVGIIGHNGSGKSTLLKVLAGVIQPKSGDLSINGTLVPLIELGAGFDPELTGRENIYLCCALQGMTKREIDKLVPAIVAFSELEDDIDQPVKTYSSGMYMRLGFSCSTVVSADIILIDEILAVGDQNFQKKCFKRLERLLELGSTIIIVSHDISTMQAIASRLVVLDRGAKVFDGSIHEGMAFYEEHMEEKRIAKLSKEERTEEVRRKKLRQESHEFGHSAKILSVKIDPDKDHIESGSGIKIIIEIALLNQHDRKPCVGFAIHARPHGFRVLGLNTNVMRGVTWSASLIKSGTYSVVFELESIPLATGSYTVTAAIHNDSLTKTFDIRPECIEFTIKDPMDSTNFDGDIVPSHLVVKNCVVDLRR